MKKFAAAALLLTSSSAWTSPVACPPTSRLRPSAATGAPSRQADDLLEKLEAHTNACIEKGECLVDEFLSLKTDLADAQHLFEEQIDAYRGDLDDDDLDDDDVAEGDGLAGDAHVMSGASVEQRALRKYLHQLRDLHASISHRLDELDGLLGKLQACRSGPPADGPLDTRSTR